MKDQELLERITVNPKVMVGKPIIRGTRLTVEYILNLLAYGATVTEIVSEYKGMKCFLYTLRRVGWTMTTLSTRRIA